MSVIAEFSIPSEEFILGKALQKTHGLSIELEQMIPTGNETIPYFWVIGEDKEQFEAVLEQEPELTGFTMIDEINDRRVYRIEWNSAADTFVQAIVEHDVVLQDAGGDADTWEFQMRFLDSDALSEFHTHCDERGIDVTVARIYNPIESITTERRRLTEGQRDLIERLYDAGYFDVPRKVTLEDVADELGISDQAVNERLRRGLQTLVRETVKSHTDRAD